MATENCDTGAGPLVQMLGLCRTERSPTGPMPTLPALVDDGVIVDAIRGWVIHTSLHGLLALLGEHELQAHLARLG